MCGVPAFDVYYWLRMRSALCRSRHDLWMGAHDIEYCCWLCHGTAMLRDGGLGRVFLKMKAVHSILVIFNLLVVSVGVMFAVTLLYEKYGRPTTKRRSRPAAKLTKPR